MMINTRAKQMAASQSFTNAQVNDFLLQAKIETTDSLANEYGIEEEHVQIIGKKFDIGNDPDFAQHMRKVNEEFEVKMLAMQQQHDAIPDNEEEVQEEAPEMD